MGNWLSKYTQKPSKPHSNPGYPHSNPTYDLPLNFHARVWALGLMGVGGKTREFGGLRLWAVYALA